MGCGHIVNLVGGEKGEGNKDKAQGWLVVWKLSDCICCISGQVEHLQGKENYLSFCLLTWPLGRIDSILDLEIISTYL